MTQTLYPSRRPLCSRSVRQSPEGPSLVIRTAVPVLLQPSRKAAWPAQVRLERSVGGGRPRGIVPARPGVLCGFDRDWPPSGRRQSVFRLRHWVLTMLAVDQGGREIGEMFRG
ncbi:hypothetical protein ACFU5O_20620 [Streptomyces sp. NPDC057445]|uniref:hypothetical protein n=1 Tax=Streptomyces sp. NPDC057445 TaxID=3346136 RepID=UPI00369BEB15